MNENKQPRKLNTSGAQHKTVYRAASGDKPQANAAPNAPRKLNRTAGENAHPAREMGAVDGGSHTPERVNTRRTTQTSAAHKKKKTKKKGCLLPLLITVAVLLVIFLVAWRVIMNAIRPNENTTSLKDFITSIGTPEEYSGDVVNILVCGIDSDDGETRDYGDGSNDGMTDMIMYVNFDVKNKQAHLLQIPRNTFVGGEITTPNGTYTSSNGQINAVMYSNDGDIAALCDVVNYQLQLPVDHYITINMAALKQVVDTFGGIEVYVPHDMEYGGSSLAQGYQTMDGNAAEFFVRCRKGEGFERSDLDRLNMQRYFYSGLLRRIRTMTFKDAVKLTPAFMNYVTTDLDTATIAKLAISLLKTDSANIMLCQLPIYNCGARYLDTHSVVVAAAEQDAALLNQYFRDYTGEVPAADMHVADWPISGDASDPNIQFMGQLDTEAENGQENENLDGSYTVTAENTAVQ